MRLIMMVNTELIHDRLYTVNISHHHYMSKVDHMIYQLFNLGLILKIIGFWAVRGTTLQHRIL